MNPESRLTYSELRQHLTPENIKPIQIIQLSLASGLIIVGALVLLLYYQIKPSQDHAVSGVLFLVRMLSLMHVMFAIPMYFLSPIILKKMISKDRLSKIPHGAVSNTEPTEMTQSEKCLFMIRSAIIVRSAMYEGVAFFGLTILLLGAAKGILQSHTVYWVNAFSTIVALWLMLKTFPSREMILDICNKAKLIV
jgi:hypothetical protein